MGRGAAAIVAACSLLGACHRAAAGGRGRSGRCAGECRGGRELDARRKSRNSVWSRNLRSPRNTRSMRAATASWSAHDTIAQAVAELATARATEQQSRSALKRAQQLSGTPGAVSADVEEAAAQKAAVDAAAMTLTTERLTSTLGMNPPWQNRDQDPTLQDLARGKIKLLRATFPLGALSGGTAAEPARCASGRHPTGPGMES